jgi:signal transduction histidine kinase
MRPDATVVSQPVGPPGQGGPRRLFVDSRGRLWLALQQGRLARLDADGTETLLGEKEGFSGGEVRCFAEDEKGAIWVGTTQGTLWRWTGERFEPVAINCPGGTGAINAIHFAGPEQVWLGTALRGIVLRRPGSTRILDVNSGLPDNNITQLVTDDHGFLWCGSGTGIFRLSRSEIEAFAAGGGGVVNPMVLGRDDGLKGITCTGLFFPGALRARDGRLWFATRQGVLVIDPAAPLLRAKPRGVRIEEITCGSQRLPAAGPVALPPGGRRVQFRFSVLCLSAPQRVHVEYRLDGFDADWVPAEKGNVAAYSELPPGDYVFRVRAGLGASSAEVVSDHVAVSVSAHWWQTGWFITLAAGAAVLLVAVAVRTWSVRRLRRRLRALEHERAVERERARIAQNIHDDLGASLTHISLLTQAALAENTPERLNRIYDATREITRSLDEIVWAVNPRHDTVESFAEYLASNAQRFLHAANLRCRLDLPAELPNIPLSSQARHHLFLCCREALNNIVKHAQATSVSIALALHEGRLSVVITDDGIGFRPPADGEASNAPSRNGVRNLHDRMAEAGGRCVIGRGPNGRGTAVSLEIPCS